MGAALPGVSLGLGAVQTGFSFFAGQQAASNAQRIAAYNLAVQQQNAQIQMALAMRQAEVQAAVARGNYSAAVAASRIHDANAKILKQNARSAEQSGIEKARRITLEKDRAIGSQRAAYGAAGVVLSGTPIDILADTAGMFALAQADARHEADMAARDLRWQSATEKWTGKVQRAQAVSHLNDAAMADWSRSLAPIQYGQTMAGARNDYAGAMSQASGMRMASFGTLLSGLGSMAGGLYNFRQYGAL